MAKRNLFSHFRRFLLPPLRVLSLSYVAFCLLLYIGQERLLFHPTIFPSTHIYSFTQPFTEINLPVTGATLNLLHFHQANAVGVVFYLHGNGDTLATADEVAARFTPHNYDVVLLDYRGYGKSTGRITDQATLLADVKTAIDYVRQRYRDDQIVLYGYSLGSGLAIQLATTFTPRLLLLEAPYLSMADMLTRRFPFIPSFLLKYPLHSDQWIPLVRSPVYIFHGTNDAVVPVDASAQLLPFIKTPAQRIVIPGGTHVNLATFSIYQNALTDILRVHRN